MDITPTTDEIKALWEPYKIWFIPTITFLFGIFIRPWLDRSFEKFRGKNQHNLDYVLSHRNKWQDKEYDIFPILWEQITQSIVHLENAMDNKLIPAVHFEQETDIEHFGSDNQFTESGIHYLKKVFQKDSSLRSMTSAVAHIFRNQDLNNALQHTKQLTTLVRNNVIFLQNDLKQKILEISKVISEVEKINRCNYEYEEDDNMRKEIANDRENNRQRFQNEILHLKQEIEDLIQNRLAPEKTS